MLTILMAIAMTANPHGSVTFVENIAIIMGSAKNDNVTLNPDSVVVNGTTTPLPMGIVGVFADLGGGNDVFTNNSNYPTVVLGGSGNDAISGGGGQDVLYGNDGSDLLLNGDLNDTLIPDDFDPYRIDYLGNIPILHSFYPNQDNQVVTIDSGGGGEGGGIANVSIDGEYAFGLSIFPGEALIVNFSGKKDSVVNTTTFPVYVYNSSGKKVQGSGYSSP